MDLNKFKNYEEFVDKFKHKKTTDDCYTPTAVYDCILNYVKKKCDIEGKEVVRPFYPGGNYEKYEYPRDCVVIDNPPFSIITKICRFYIDNNIKFFLFAPHLTLFSAQLDITRIVVGAEIIYENGAKIKTSFFSNLFADIAVISDPDLYITLTQMLTKADLPKYIYPKNILTVSKVQLLINKGIPIQFKKNEVCWVSSLDSQKIHKKSIYGSGFLLSEKAAAEKAAAEKAAAEKAAAEKADYILWELSDREKNIINELK